MRLALKGGEATHASRVTGLLFSRSCPSGRCGVYARCSAVLGADDRFFTAGHCLGDRDRDYWVFLQHGGIFRGAESAVQHYCDGRRDCDRAIHDVASLRLAEPVPDMSPPELGSLGDGKVRILGFGDSGPLLPDHGVLRTASVTTLPCEEGLICYRITDDSPAACNHDSGGPMLRDGRLVGLARRSQHGCARGLGSYTDLTVPAVTAWWLSLTRREPVDASPVNADLAENCVHAGCWRGPESTSRERVIRVHPGARRLVVTMNHALLAADGDCGNGLLRCAVDYELTVAGPDEGAGSSSCICNNELFQVAACDCPGPQAGDWRVSIRVTGRRGPFQLTGRIFY